MKGLMLVVVLTCSFIFALEHLQIEVRSAVQERHASILEKY